MASKTSFFNKAVFKKDLARFAPAAVLYTIALGAAAASLLSQASMRAPGSYYAVRFYQGFGTYLGLGSFLYASVMAALLFGDVYRGRLAPALHALPPRRESWFLCHTLAALLLNLAPTAVVTALCVPAMLSSCVENAWVLPLLYFLMANLAYLAFLGIGVFAIFCAGNLAGAAVIWAGICGWVLGLALAAQYLYEPLMLGVYDPLAGLESLCPVLVFANTDGISSLLSLDELIYRAGGDERAITASLTFHPEVLYTGVAWGLAGLALLAAALLLYRRRDVERAGDPMAFPKLDVLFQLLTTAAGGCGALIFCDGFGTAYRVAWMRWALTLCGLGVGWFAGKMLLERTGRVFRLRNWAGLALVAALFAGSLLSVQADLFGRERWVPDPEDVASVQLRDFGGVTLTEPEDIRGILRLHRLALEEPVQDSGYYDAEYLREARQTGQTISEEGLEKYLSAQGRGIGTTVYAKNIRLVYTLNSGARVCRSYNILADTEAADLARTYLSSWEMVRDQFRSGVVDGIEFAPERVWEVELSNLWDRGAPAARMTPELTASLLEAIQADCAEGTMAQDATFHDLCFERRVDAETRQASSVNISFRALDGRNNLYYLGDVNVYPDSAHTLQWLTDQGLMDGITIVPADN